MLLNTKNKKCSKCKNEKPLEAFGKDKSRKDGLYVNCKECVKVYQVGIRKKHNDQRTVYNKEYREKNKQSYNEWERNYYKENSEKLNKNAKKWRESYSGTFRMLHIITKARAKKKGLEYNLSDDVLRTVSFLQKDSCKLTRIPFDLQSDGIHTFRPFAPSIDRIDNNKGYTYDNIQIVCVMVNKAKNEYPQELFDEMCKARVSVLNGS